MKTFLAIVLSQLFFLTAQADEKNSEPYGHPACPPYFQMVKKRVCWVDPNGVKECRVVRGCQPIRRYKA